jgi:two-component system, OmpR family, response regulator BaeR
MVMKKILIVEDDNKIAELLGDYLKSSNFSVSIFNRGDNVVNEVRLNKPDLILLDVMLPGTDGLSICKEIRNFSAVPIIMISAKTEEIDRLLGLELGADDYICKPFSPREVVARIKSILRRTDTEPQINRLSAGPITMNPDEHSALVGNSDLRLTPNEFELLRVLVSRPGRVFTRNDLISKIQGYDFEGSARTIDTHVKNLRKKVDDLLPGNRIIQTIYGIGYSVNLPQSANMAAE